MALTLDPATRVFTVPQADLSFVSGTLYTLDTDQFRKDAWDLLSSEPYIWLPPCYDHNAEYTILGVTYFRKIEFINGFSLQLEDTGSAYSVSFEGSNNNLFDIETGVLIPTPLVTCVGNNSAGNQTIVAGSGVLPADITAIAAEVWDTLISSHELVGTYGSELATKSDVGGSAATTFYTAVTATIIEGVDVLGSSASINVRDGTYWQVDEDGTTGLTIEYTFNLTSADERAGVFSSFGRYTGAPNSHYLEMWAWNVESLSWEYMHERFIDNTNSDSESSHAYYERHIDRALSNKVIIRIVHNVTGYSTNHEFHQDSIQLSSIDVTSITQQDKDDIEAQIFAHTMEGTETFAQSMLLQRAAAAGQIVQLADGTYKIKSADALKDRIEGDDAANNGRDITGTDVT